MHAGNMQASHFASSTPLYLSICQTRNVTGSGTPLHGMAYIRSAMRLQPLIPAFAELSVRRVVLLRKRKHAWVWADLTASAESSVAVQL